MANNNNASKGYSDEDENLCKEILRKTDYYEILGISKTSADDEIKRNDQKISLKLHPDKNHAPQATDAFKKVTQAYSCLSNKEKRKIYDEHGTEQNFRQQYFEEEEDEFDIFDLLFNDGPIHGRRRRYYRRENPPPQRGSYLRIVIMLAALLLLLFLQITNPFNNQSYFSEVSLSSYYPYVYPRTTNKLKTTYYVTKKFKEQYWTDQNVIEDVDDAVDRQILSDLAKKCRNIKYREYLISNRINNYKIDSNAKDQ